jgi:hypothetical protein
MTANPSIERTSTGLARFTSLVYVPLRGPSRFRPLMSNVRRHAKKHTASRIDLLPLTACSFAARLGTSYSHEPKGSIE